jgi:hypothetical protein
MNVPDDFRFWLKLFSRWLIGFQSTSAKQQIKPLEFFERRLADGKLETRLTLLPDNDNRFGRRSGATATWKLVHHAAPGGTLLITLDNLYKLSLEMEPSQQSEIIRRGIERSKGLTHRFQVTWFFWSASAGKLRFILIDSFDIDLSSRFVDESARDIIRTVVLDAFTMRSIPSMNWRERIQYFPWAESIRQLSPLKGCPQNPRLRQLTTKMHKVTVS